MDHGAQANMYIPVLSVDLVSNMQPRQSTEDKAGRTTPLTVLFVNLFGCNLPVSNDGLFLSVAAELLLAVSL